MARAHRLSRELALHAKKKPRLSLSLGVRGLYITLALCARVGLSLKRKLRSALLFLERALSTSPRATCQVGARDREVASLARPERRVDREGASGRGGGAAEEGGLRHRDLLALHQRLRGRRRGPRARVFFHAKQKLASEETFEAGGRALSVLCVRCSFGVTIVDESHYLRTRDSQRTQLICPLISASKRLLLLSGTPATLAA